MAIHRDRWPAILTGEQEDILLRAGFLYESDLACSLTRNYARCLRWRLPPSGGCDLRSFVSRPNARRVEIVCDGEPARDFRDTGKETLSVGVNAI